MRSRLRQSRRWLYSLLVIPLGIVFSNMSVQAEPMKIVSPKGFENQPGDDNGGLGGSPLRAQHLHSATGFESLAKLPASQRWLVGIASRPDESNQQEYDIAASMTLKMGTTIRTNLDMDFSKNVDNPTLVFDGKYRYRSSGDPPVGTAYPFDEGIALQHHFNYDPAQGALVMEFAVSGSYPALLRYDATTRENITDIVNFGSMTAPTATDAYGWIPIMQFVFAERGDFNGDLAVDAKDLDLLSASLRNGTAGPRVDVDDNHVSESADRTFWVHDVKKTWFGDADLNGRFESRDLIEVFGRGQYDDGESENSTWASGDWDGDSEFASGDLILAFQDGGYDAGPRTGLAIVVPEPTTQILVTLTTLGMALIRKQRSFRH